MPFALCAKRTINKSLSITRDVPLNGLKGFRICSDYLEYRAWHDINYKDLGTSRSVTVEEIVGGVFKKRLEEIKKFSFNVNKWEF